MKSALILPFVVALAVGTPAKAADPRRDRALSAHMLPQRVARLDTTGRAKWGFVISFPGDNRVPLKWPVVQSAQALVDFLRRQPRRMQENGIWLVVTQPHLYSKQEKAIVENLKRICRKVKVPLLICRGAVLPDCWNDT